MRCMMSSAWKRAVWKWTTANESVQLFIRICWNEIFIHQSAWTIRKANILIPLSFAADKKTMETIITDWFISSYWAFLRANATLHHLYSVIEQRHLQSSPDLRGVCKQEELLSNKQQLIAPIRIMTRDTRDELLKHHLRPLIGFRGLHVIVSWNSGKNTDMKRWEGMKMAAVNDALKKRWGHANNTYPIMLNVRIILRTWETWKSCH